MPWRFLTPPPVYDPAATAARVNRALFFVGAACLSVGLRFFVFPEQLATTSVGRALTGMWDESWSLAYIVGGLLMVTGIGLRRPRIELPGLTLCFTATAVNGAAIMVVVGASGLSQLPLYVLALWVFDGRIRDLRDLPRERRRGQPDARAERAERRLFASALPLFVFAAGGETASTLIVALLGGGIITAVVQAFLYRPQRRDLEGRLSLTAVEAADIALRQAREEVGVLRVEIAELRGQLGSTTHRCDVLESLLIEHGIPVPT